MSSLEYTVTCIARQRTGKHLATEYTHATIELRMLLLVARQQSALMKLLTRNYDNWFYVGPCRDHCYATAR
jgi:hypothetical protein